MAYTDSIPLVANARYQGQTYTDSELIYCVNASGSEVAVGRAMIKTGLSDAMPTVKAPVAADFTAKNLTSVIANWSSGETVTAVISFRGTLIPVGPVAFDTDNNTSVTALATAINTAMDARYTAAQSLLAAATTGTLVVTAEIAGEDFDIDYGYNGNITATKVIAGTTLVGALVGWSADEGAAVVNSSDSPVVQDGRGFPVVRKGTVDAVMNAAAATARTDALYIITDASGTPGAVTASAGASRVWVPSSIVRWNDAPATATTSPRGAVATLTIVGL